MRNCWRCSGSQKQCQRKVETPEKQFPMIMLRALFVIVGLSLNTEVQPHCFAKTSFSVQGLQSRPHVGRAIFAENLRDRIIKVRLSKNGNTPQNCHVSMGEDDEWCDGEPYFQTFNLRFGSKVSLHPLWIRSNLYPSCDQKNRFTNPILCFFHLWTQYLKPLYVYIIYIYINSFECFDS